MKLILASKSAARQEMLANAAALNAPAIACHFNNPGYNLVHELLVRMREQGYNVYGELYPYAAGSTALNAVFLTPEYWVEQDSFCDILDEEACSPSNMSNGRGFG